MDNEMRLQKYLAMANVASRRASEKIITDGRVKVNGKTVTELGTKVTDGDEVEVDFDSGVITNCTTGKTYKAQPFPPFIQNIIKNGGLMNSIEK